MEHSTKPAWVANTATVLVLVVFPAAAFWFFASSSPFTEKLSGFSDFLSDYAAYAAVLIAATKGAQEINSWRTRKEENNQSALAGQAIVASIKLSNALRSVCDLSKRLLRSEHGDTAPPKEIPQAWEVYRLTLMANRAASLQDFQQVLAQARGYLPTPAVEALDELEVLQANLTQTWDLLFNVLLQDSPKSNFSWLVDLREQHSKIDEYEKNIEPALENIKTTLRRYTVGFRRG